jgi:hypothetical protein
MKKYLLVAPLLLVVFLVQAQSAAPKQNGPVIAWEKSSHDFGDVVQGDKVEHTFVFTNVGTEDLIITNVNVSCGCTTPKGWPKDPIPPGGKGQITIGYNSAGRSGKQNKAATVVSNSVGSENQISFTVNVIVKSVPQ